MKTLSTEITIDASPQTVWSILDNLARYPDWNPITPTMGGTTTVDSQLRGQLVILDKVDRPFSPVLTRVVGARELRWMTQRPDPEDFSAEHCFTLTPTNEGGTHVSHFENFDGRLLDEMWPLIDTSFREAYEAFNQKLKERAEAMSGVSVLLHPAVDEPAVQQECDFSEVLLECQCAENKVTVKLEENISHNHLCGCSKCWKPKGALFAQIAVVPSDTTEVTANNDKLEIVDVNQHIRRYACTGCKVHMLGRVSNKDHHFYGLTFVHPELVTQGPLAPPEFAAFVSSLIESGSSASHMQSIRERLNELELGAYDTFSPEIMDIISWHQVKLAGSLEA